MKSKEINRDLRAESMKPANLVTSTGTLHFTSTTITTSVTGDNIPFCFYSNIILL